MIDLHEQHQLPNSFAQYAGVEVNLDNEGKPTQKSLELMEEINKVAVENRTPLLIRLPEVRGPMDLQNNRVNFHVQKGNDGKWRFGRKCTYG
jgi:hypothetical protein